MEEIAAGQVWTATFAANRREGSRHGFVARHLDGRPSPKVVLCSDPRIRPGVACRVRVRAVQSAKRRDHGAIVVELVEAAPAPLELEEVYLEPAVKRRLQALLVAGRNVLLMGPQGCGKTVAARSLAGALGLELTYFHCGAVVEATDFVATLTVRASSSGQPVPSFVKTDVLRALEAAVERPKTRFLVLLDELNRCQGAARNSLMPALDQSRCLYNPIANEFVPVPGNVQFIATVNVGHGFSGTFEIDLSQLDRFAPVRMGYLPCEREMALLQRRHPALPKRITRLVVELANSIRSEPAIEAGLSVRATDEACLALSHPCYGEGDVRYLAEVLLASFAGRFPGELDDESSEAGVVAAHLRGGLRRRRLPLAP